MIVKRIRSFVSVASKTLGINPTQAIGYSEETLKERLNYLKELKGDFVFSEQYGRYLLLDRDNGIILNITALVQKSGGI